MHDDRVDYKRFYEEQGLKYGNDHLPREYARIQFVLGNLRLTDRVLEVGCQTGGITRFLADASEEVIAIDVSSTYLDRARKINKDNVSFRCQFGEDITATNEFDVVVLMEVIEHVLDPSRLLSVAYAALKPGGKLLCTVPDEDYIDPLGEHKTVFTETTFANLLGEHFTDLFTFHKKVGEYDGWYFGVATKC